MPSVIPFFLTLLVSLIAGISSLSAKCIFPNEHRTTATTKTYYVYSLGLLYEVDELENSKTHHYDQVGSTLARTDDIGKVIGRAEYSAYGITIWKEGDMATPFLYNGQAGVQTDSNGLLNMRARYYSPYLMRFLNADPIGFSGGSNWFAYADGNPISLSDPFGLCADRNACTGGTGRRGVTVPFPVWSEYSGMVHGGLDVVGLIPGAGEFADGAGALIYLAEGNKRDAAIGAAAMIPIAGWLATGSKAVRYGDEAYEILDGVRRAKANSIVGNQSVVVDVFDNSGAKFLETKTIDLTSLTSLRSEVDVSNLTNINRFADVHQGVLSGSSMPNIKVREGSKGVSIQDVKFKY